MKHYLATLIIFCSFWVQAQNPVAGWYLTSDTVQCLNNNSFFGDDTSKVIGGGNYNKTWYYGDGDSCHCLYPNHSYSNPGKYEIKLLIESNGIYDSMSHFVYVLPSAKAYFSVNKFQTCRDEGITFSDTVTNNYGAKREWRWGDGTFDTARVVTHYFALAGSFAPMLFYRYTNGCNDSNDNFTLDILGVTHPRIYINQARQCETGNLFILSDSSSSDNGITHRYIWSGSSLIDSNVSTTFTAPSYGDYRIIMTTISSSGCVSGDTVNLHVYKQPSIDWTFAPAAFCAGSTTSFSTFGSLNVGDFDSIYYTYWHEDTLYSSDTSAILMNVKDSGRYQIKAHNGTCTDSTSTVFLRMITPIKSTITQSGDTLIANEGVNYNWFVNGQFISGANTRKYIPQKFAKYTVWVTDSFYCGLPSDTLFNTGISDPSVETFFAIYPSVVTDQAMIYTESIEAYTYQVVTINGKIVTSAGGRGNEQLVLKDLSSGVYLLIINQMGRQFHMKILKQ